MRNGARLNVDMLDGEGLTPIHRVVHDPEQLEIFMEHGADVRTMEAKSASLVNHLWRVSDERADEARDKTPWKEGLDGMWFGDKETEDWVKCDRCKFRKSLRILLTNGAKLNVEIKNKKGLTRMHQAVHDPKLLEILIDHGADLQSAEKNNDSLITTLLKDFDEDNCKKYKKSLHLLLSNGARLNVDMEDDKGLTAMHHAAQEYCKC